METIQGATVDERCQGMTTEDRLHIFGTNLASLAQGLVNNHYELCRMQMLMDRIIEDNAAVLKLPDVDMQKEIDKQATADTKKTFAHFFIDKETTSSTT